MWLRTRVGTAMAPQDEFLVGLWVRTDHCICADSYFSYVNTVMDMARMVLHFIGVVKAVTKNFPMTYPSNLELNMETTKD